MSVPLAAQFTLEYCESLMRQNPAATARLYHRVEKELREMEATEKPTANGSFESVHRWDVRAALLDGPKTAQQCANWARERGNQHIDRPLADNILRNLIRAEEVGIGAVNTGKPPVYVATASMKQPPPEIPSAPVAEPPTEEPVAPRETGNDRVSMVLADCNKLREGEEWLAPVPNGVSVRRFAQQVRVTLASRRSTKPYSWSVHEDGELIRITKRGFKVPAAAAAPPVKLASADESRSIVAKRNPPLAVIEATPPTAEAGAAEPKFRFDLFVTEVDRRIAALTKLRDALQFVREMGISLP